MDVLERGVEGKPARTDLGLHLVETGQDPLAVVRRNDAPGDQHPAVGARERDVLQREAAIDIDGGIDPLHQGIRCGRKPPAPQRMTAVRCLVLSFLFALEAVCRFVR